MEDRNSSESARHLFLRALRFHPNNKKVYQEVELFWKKHEFPQMKKLDELDIYFFFILRWCVSTSVWNCFTARSWGSRRSSWRKLRWIWWGRCSTSAVQKQPSPVCTWVLSLSHMFQGEYEFSPEILSGKLAEVVYRDAAGKIQGRKSKILYTHKHWDTGIVSLSVLAWWN